MTAIPPSRETASILAKNSLEAVAEYRTATEAYLEKYYWLVNQVEPPVKTLIDCLIEAINDQHSANAEIVYTELARHFPILADTIPMIVTHILEQSLDEHGHCCTGGNKEHADG